ncbi:MAG: mannitol dehydrogenase family protein, partial [Gammaproteobacteria bacterium]|nr:mannitol dehydrogenase family protein [Gammaproteobacteria bacterium]
MTTTLSTRLSQADLADVSTNVQMPTYDRTKLDIGIVHIGIGAFHRCHQAEFLEDVAEAGYGQGMAGINLAPPEIEPALAPQDCLYSRTLAHGDERETRIIGVIRKVLDYSNSPEGCRNLIANPLVSTVTMTVTEKGYCHVPSTGKLDETNVNVVRD